MLAGGFPATELQIENQTDPRNGERRTAIGCAWEKMFR